jgi:GTP-binding protein
MAQPIFIKFGLGEPVPISGIHGRNIEMLLDRIIEYIPESAEPARHKRQRQTGHCRASKCRQVDAVNAIAGEERVIVDSTPGTTRDAVDSMLSWDGHEIMLIDTAGIRRRGKTGTGIDFYSLIRAMHAINRCDIALLVVDATELLTAQDTHIAGYIKDASKGMILIVNKWDLVPDSSKYEFDSYIAERLKFAAFCPVLYVSAKTGKGVDKILPAAFKVWDERQKKMPDDVVNKLIKDAVAKQAPARIGTKRLQVIRAYQSGVNPPRFLFLVNDPKLVHFSYERYLENKLRQTFGFSGTSLKLNFVKAPVRRRRRTK